MANNSLIFTNARVKTLENNLLSEEKIMRLVQADSLEEGVKLLTESNYGGGIVSDACDFEDILSAEEKRLSEFLAEAMPKNSGLEGFLIKNDYHNAKAITKAKYAKIADFDFMLCPQGLIDLEELKEKIFNDNYSSFSPIMQDALTKIDNYRANGEKSPRIIDCVLDIAMYKEIMKIAKASKVESIIRYWVTNIDMCNISNFVRCIDTNQSFDFFEQDFISGGSWDLSYFQDKFGQSKIEFAENMKYSIYSKVVLEALTMNNMTLLEKNIDDYCLKIFSIDKNNIFSVAPIAGYFVAKKIEIKVVRMILILLKINADKSLIKDRLRDIYA